MSKVRAIGCSGRVTRPLARNVREAPGSVKSSLRACSRKRKVVRCDHEIENGNPTSGFTEPPFRRSVSLHVRQKMKRKRQRNTMVTKKHVLLASLLLMAACVLAVAVHLLRYAPVEPHTLSELLDLREDKLVRVDIARMNLLCATGLPNSENIKLEEYLQTLDRWAEVIKKAEEKYLPNFYRNPAKYENSLSKFKAITLVLTIQEDLNFFIRYTTSLFALNWIRRYGKLWRKSCNPALQYGPRKYLQSSRLRRNHCLTQNVTWGRIGLQLIIA